ncbi:TIGR01777 family oxidoreductase [Salinithrix halophila]|uniref:TIGR01777 family oxidoreductase n=1 Tax=Salinithrix halophila TaxID=1485204 RepID=A0ABV8JDE0_9BACL
MRIIVTGAHGLVGTEVVRDLRIAGHEVIPLVRRREWEGIFWDPSKGEIDGKKLEGTDAVLHFAGENISSGRWTVKQKERILQSRVKGTTLLAETLADLQKPPSVLLSASAVGFYGSCLQGETVDEDSPLGEGFLARVTEAWEHSTKAAEVAGIRVVHMRFGMILSQKGGALAKMLPIFRLGIGGKLGDGKQSMSWISLSEVPCVIRFLLEHEELHGPVNVTAPQSVSNVVFTRTLGSVLHRPTLFPVPRLLVKAVFGEMGEELLLSGCRVLPQKLTMAGYSFAYPSLNEALIEALQRR